jgi:membrane protein required for beta-lactamase induction
MGGMKFLILLICLLIQAIFKGIKKNKQRLIDNYLMGIKPFLTSLNLIHNWRGLIGLLVPALVVILILNYLLIHARLLYFLYSLFILWLCLDFQDVNAELRDYFTFLTDGNIEKAQREAEHFVGYPLAPNRSEITRAVTKAIFTRSLTHLFAVIFWFMLLGPFGAVLYALTAAITANSQQPVCDFHDFRVAAAYFKNILDWIPVRFVIFTFALISHFGPVFNFWLERLGADLSENKQVLVDGGLVALNLELSPANGIIENQQALKLISHTLWTWVIVILILTFVSWL